MDVPVVAFGCGPSAGLMVGGDRRAQEIAVGRALSLGIDLFDTAAAYGSGKSEIALGIALRACGTKADVSTKAVIGSEDLGDIYGSVLRSVEGSLRRLDRDSVTMLFLHNRVAKRRDATRRIGVGPVLSVEDVLGHHGVAEAFAELRSAGVVGCGGFTAYGGEISAIKTLMESGAFGVVNVSYNLINPSAFLEVTRVHSEENYLGIADLAAARNMGVLCIRVLASGKIGQLGRDADKAVLTAGELARYLGDGDSAEGALRFVLSTPGVSSAVVGISEPEHVDRNASAAMKGNLDSTVLAEARRRLVSWGVETDPT